MKSQWTIFSFLILIGFGTACRVSGPVSSSTTRTEPAKMDSVQIDIYPLPSNFNAIEAIPVFPDTIAIVGVGDIMLGTNFPEAKYLPPDSGRHLLDDVEPILSSADLSFGNLEGVLLNQGGDPKNCRNPDICYLFRSPDYMALRLYEVGFDLLSTANNHAGDFGEPGRSRTAFILDSLDIFHAGSLEKPLVNFSKSKIRYGFAAFAPNKGTPSIFDIDSAKKSIIRLDSLSDIVIVSFHGGAEGKEYMNVSRKEEYFYGENRGNVYEFAHSMIDAGADIVFGHGPHVPRAVEVYKQKFIAYSLGNFCTYARFNLQGENAYAPIIKVLVDHQGNFLEGRIISAIQTGLGVPVIDQKNRAARLIKRLTEEDFQEAKIVIGDSGVITYIEE